MTTFEKVREIICEILDHEPDEIGMESYMIRELDTESIDLLELSLEISESFKIDVKDDALFLRSLRYHIKEAQDNGLDTPIYLAEKLPHLNGRRIWDIMEDLDNGPTLKVKDLTAYVDFHAKG